LRLRQFGGEAFKFLETEFEAFKFLELAPSEAFKFLELDLEYAPWLYSTRALPNGKGCVRISNHVDSRPPNYYQNK